MHELNDMALLREYAARGSESAFAELVSQRVGFVYSAALRQTGDAHRAQEITQSVFVILAQKAGRISDKTNLTGWLFKTTRFVALAQKRADSARWRREQEFHMQTESFNAPNDPAWEVISPHLDEALMCLGEKDRQTVLLHYFERKS
ncbi:MAG TPA: sigma-70 family RNA polymerase sigma factor, partial [Verrucomicrobiae bacterium]|nr:sigma-70 family RNA polymerase sigma factor [Verrucomicrobiae bacterium]